MTNVMVLEELAGGESTEFGELAVGSFYKGRELIIARNMLGVTNMTTLRRGLGEGSINVATYFIETEGPKIESIWFSGNTEYFKDDEAYEQLNKILKGAGR